MSCSPSENALESSASSTTSGRSSSSSSSRRSSIYDALSDITNSLLQTSVAISPKQQQRRKLRLRYKKRILRREQPITPGVNRVIDIDLIKRSTDDKEAAAVLKKKEVAYAISVPWFEVQKRNSLQQNMYEVLTSWLAEVIEGCKMERATYLLAVNYLQRFLAKSAAPTPPSSLQLLGVTCLLIAYKIWENKETLTVHFLAKLTDYACTPCQIQAMESAVLNRNGLDFMLNPPTPLSFLDRLLTASAVHDTPKELECRNQVEEVCNFLFECAATKPLLFGVTPSLQTAAAVALARYTLGFNVWSQTLLYYSQHSKEDILATAGLMLQAALACPAIIEKRFTSLDTPRSCLALLLDGFVQGNFSQLPPPRAVAPSV